MCGSVRSAGQPIVGQYGFGPYICSVFDWQLNLATIQPVDLRIDVSESFLPELPTGTFERPGITAEALGAFRIETDWKFSLPRLCRCLKP